MDWGDYTKECSRKQSKAFGSDSSIIFHSNLRFCPHFDFFSIYSLFFGVGRGGMSLQLSRANYNFLLIPSSPTMGEIYIYIKSKSPTPIRTKYEIYSAKKKRTKYEINEILWYFIFDSICILTLSPKKKHINPTIHFYYKSKS